MSARYLHAVARSKTGDGTNAPLPDVVLVDYDDAVMETVVLISVIAQRPRGVTIMDLARRLSPPDPQVIDIVERAVLELVRARLLRMDGPFVVPDRAVLASDDAGD